MGIFRKKQLLTLLAVLLMLTAVAVVITVWPGSGASRKLLKYRGVDPTKIESVRAVRVSSSGTFTEILTEEETAEVLALLPRVGFFDEPLVDDGSRAVDGAGNDFTFVLTLSDGTDVWLSALSCAGDYYYRLWGWKGTSSVSEEGQLYYHAGCDADTVATEEEAAWAALKQLHARIMGR